MQMSSYLSSGSQPSNFGKSRIRKNIHIEVRNKFFYNELFISIRFSEQKSKVIVNYVNV